MIPFFDASCAIGKAVAPNTGSFQDAATLIEKMQLCNIEKALVWQTSALEYHPRQGNEEILKVTGENENLLPVWVVMPNHTGEFYDPPELVSLIKKHNVRAVKLFPGYEFLAYSLEEWSCGELFAQLAENGVPVLIDAEQTDWNTIYSICRRYPNLKLIVTKVYYRYGRYFYPLLRKLSNLYIETSFYKSFMGIEDICQRFGAERLVFGTTMPLFDPGPAVAMIWRANISQEEKELIASRNLERILGI